MKVRLVQLCYGIIYSILIAVISMGSSLVIAGIFFGRSGMNEMMVDSTNLLMGVLGTPLIILVTKRYYQKHAKNNANEIDFLNKNRFKKIGNGLIVGFTTVFMIFIGLLLVGAKVSFNGISNWFSILSGVSTFIGMATLEECIFRGVLRQTFSNFGNKIGNILPIFLFTAMHMDLWQNGDLLRVLDLLMGGVLFTIILYKSKSMLLTSSAHAAVNISAAIVFGIDTQSGIFKTSLTTASLNFSAERLSTMFSIFVSLLFSILILTCWKNTARLTKHY